MAKTSTIYARLKDFNHPTGSMRRAGFVFTLQVGEYEVTPDQENAIRADAAIVILDHAPAGQIQKVSASTTEKTTPAERDPFDHIPATVDLGEAKKSASRMGKAEIVEALQGKGLTAGTDFEESAPKEALLQLLESL